MFSPDKPLLNKPFPKSILRDPPYLHFSKENPTTKQIDEIIYQIVSISHGDYQRFLIRKKGLSDSENSWIERR